MFSFTKPLENLIGAAYLSGALEGLNKYKTLNPSELQSYEEDSKHVRRVLLNRAESDGYKQPVHHIEEAKEIAKNVLNTRGKNNKSLNSLSTVSTQSSPTTVEPIKEEHMESPTTLSNLKTEEHTLESEVSHLKDEIKNIEDHELQPLPKTPNSSKPVNKPSTPPPVLQLGGRKKRSTRRRANRKNRKSRHTRK